MDSVQLDDNINYECAFLWNDICNNQKYCLKRKVENQEFNNCKGCIFEHEHSRKVTDDILKEYANYDQAYKRT